MYRPVLDPEHPILRVDSIVASIYQRRELAELNAGDRLSNESKADEAVRARLRAVVHAAVVGAVDQARSSPCRKSHCGAAGWSIYSTVEDIAVILGHNAPPPPMSCVDDTCRAICTHAAEHAEAAVLRQHLRTGWAPTDVLHIKVDLKTGEPVPSAGPSCASCSCDMLAAGVEFVWLWLPDGWRAWTAADFHRLSLQADPKIPESLSHEDIDRLFTIKPRTRPVP